jgi:fructose-1-phosphate kinase PfkB-like protein
MIGWTLSAIVVVSLLATGFVIVVAPRRSSEQFGIALDDPRAFAFIRAMGARDAVIGGLLALMLVARSRELLGWAMCLGASVAVSDLLLVVADRRLAGSHHRVDAQVLLHTGGAVGLLVTAAALFAGV